MTTEIRRATADDIPHLARFQTAAYGGGNEVLYDGLAPGQSTESLVQPQFSQPDTTPFYENHWIAMCDGRVAGAMHAFPMEDMAGFLRDSLVPEERHEEAGEYLHQLPAPGNYCIHVLVVYPEFHRKGIASILLSLALKQAAEKGFAECSLYVFSDNVGAIALYKKYGFKAAGRCPMAEHSLYYFAGDMVHMTCEV
jgi:ribosomal protein S18 acetylase RimI-like enzyme